MRVSSVEVSKKNLMRLVWWHSRKPRCPPHWVYLSMTDCGRT